MILFGAARGSLFGAAGRRGVSSFFGAAGRRGFAVICACRGAGTLGIICVRVALRFRLMFFLCQRHVYGFILYMYTSNTYVDVASASYEWLHIRICLRST